MDRRKLGESSVRITAVPVKIRTGKLPNSNEKPYRNCFVVTARKKLSQEASQCN
jgi:hypothetical protein